MRLCLWFTIKRKRKLLREQNDWTFVNLLNIRWPLWQTLSLAMRHASRDNDEVPVTCGQLWCPDGGTPKDGPSAGAALTLAIYSLLMGLKVNREVSMTGEINLKGRVTKIGGLEEKLQGAKKAGVKLALIPGENEDDLVKIKERNDKLITDNFKVVSVGTFDDVLTFALA